MSWLLPLVSILIRSYVIINTLHERFFQKDIDLLVSKQCLILRSKDVYISKIHLSSVYPSQPGYEKVYMLLVVYKIRRLNFLERYYLTEISNYTLFGAFGILTALSILSVFLVYVCMYVYVICILRHAEDHSIKSENRR